MQPKHKVIYALLDQMPELRDGYETDINNYSLYRSCWFKFDEQVITGQAHPSEMRGGKRLPHSKADTRQTPCSCCVRGSPEPRREVWAAAAGAAPRKHGRQPGQGARGSPREPRPLHPPSPWCPGYSGFPEDMGNTWIKSLQNAISLASSPGRGLLIITMKR